MEIKIRNNSKTAKASVPILNKGNGRVAILPTKVESVPFADLRKNWREILVTMKSVEVLDDEVAKVEPPPAPEPTPDPAPVARVEEKKAPEPAAKKEPAKPEPKVEAPAPEVKKAEEAKKEAPKPEDKKVEAPKETPEENPKDKK